MDFMRKTLFRDSSTGRNDFFIDPLAFERSKGTVWLRGGSGGLGSNVLRGSLLSGEYEYGCDEK